jgi:glycosyltransferase involved in cell wall biosynthesis
VDSNGHKLRVLFISHDHPAFGPGEIETYALQLYKAMRKSGAVEPIFLARVGFPSALEFPRHLGTPFGIFDEDDNEYWVVSEISDFDWLNLTVRRKSLYTSCLKHFLLGHRPDVVHIQSTLYLGLGLLSLIKRALPEATIVHSLHDYRAICHRDGVMVRSRAEELCDHYSPRRCNECFPDVPPPEFLLRKRFVEAQLGEVDLFLAPSRFLMDKYVDWGIPPAKIQVSELGRPVPEMGEARASGRRDRFGFFGELNPHSGVVLLLNAMKVLADPEARLRLHGGNLEWQPFGFQDEFKQLLASNSANVTLVERYDETDLPSLMEEIDWVVVPSLWWEGGPLVVQDAFRYGKPVICSGIGALAEKVAHEVNGLHFRRGDRESLAAVMRRASESQDLWAGLRKGIPDVKSIEDDAEALIVTYRQLHESRTAIRA